MNISSRISASRPLATTAVHGRVEQLKSQGVDVIDFSIAISHFPAPAAVLTAMTQAIAQHALPYTSVAGAAQIRSNLVAKLRNENQINAVPDEIIVTNGAKQALYEALYVTTDPGDGIVIFKPHWPAYVATAQLLGLKPILVDLPQQITPAFLDSLPAAKVIIINNPHNPTGKVFTSQELTAIKCWMARRDCIAIVDESYEKLLFEGRHLSFASIDNWREPGIVTLFSASQSYAMMGWRIGFALAPTHIVQAMEILQGPITAAAPALSQIAADAAFASGDSQAMLEDYRARRDTVLKMFEDVPWITMHCPQSGPYLWGNVSRLTIDTIGFAELLLEQEKVAIMPGEALGISGYIRIGYISDDVATLRHGVEKIIQFGNNMASKMD